MERLKSCPFCGGEAELKQFRVSYSRVPYEGLAYRVECSSCGAVSPYKWGTIYGNFKDDEINLAFEAWNRRPLGTIGVYKDGIIET